MNDLNTHAEACAARVPASLGFDPITLIALFTQILPLITQCFARNDEADPAAMRANVRAQNERAPEKLLKRTARRIRGEADEKMSKAQSLVLAKAVIDHACESDDETVSTFARACGRGDA